jgi:predicted cobalt transporter CbtA
VLIGAGFVSFFSGGGPLLVAGLALAVGLGFRFRAAARGWSALVYGLGASVAVLLLPYVLRPPRCQTGSPGCFDAFTRGTFIAAVLIAAVGAGLALFELSRRPRG